MATIWVPAMSGGVRQITCYVILFEWLMMTNEGQRGLSNCLASHSLKKKSLNLIPKYPTLDGNFK